MIIKRVFCGIQDERLVISHHAYCVPIVEFLFLTNNVHLAFNTRKKTQNLKSKILLLMVDAANKIKIIITLHIFFETE